MTKETLLEIYQDHLREGFNKYTRKAFQMLPGLDKPEILDIGCGSGVPTIELARLSNGQIIGLDIQQFLLDELKRKGEKAGTQWAGVARTGLERNVIKIHESRKFVQMYLYAQYCRYT